MLVIRLFRVGKKNQPVFKIVVTEKTQPPRAGVFIEELGFYNPLTKEKIFKEERLKHWLKMGALPSDTVHNLLVVAKIITGEKRKIILKKPEPKPESETKQKTEALEVKPTEPAAVPVAEPTPEPELTEKKEELQL